MKGRETGNEGKKTAYTYGVHVTNTITTRRHNQKKVFFIPPIRLCVSTIQINIRPGTKATGLILRIKSVTTVRSTQSETADKAKVTAKHPHSSETCRCSTLKQVTCFWTIRPANGKQNKTWSAAATLDSRQQNFIQKWPWNSNTNAAKGSYFSSVP